MFSSRYVILAFVCIIGSGIATGFEEFGVAVVFGLLFIFCCFSFLSCDICEKLKQYNKDKKENTKEKGT